MLTAKAVINRFSMKAAEISKFKAFLLVILFAALKLVSKNILKQRIVNYILYFHI